jgi:hypothetical protein
VVVARAEGPDLFVEEARRKPEQQAEHELRESEDDQQDPHAQIIAGQLPGCTSPHSSSGSGAYQGVTGVVRRHGNGKRDTLTLTLRFP